MSSWDWDEELASEGMGHYSESGTDYTDATQNRQAYDYQVFDEISPTPEHAWPLHEDSGTTIVDKAGDTTGTYNGVSVANTIGPLGVDAPSWDGTDDWGDLGGAQVSVTASSSWSICGWIKTTTTAEQEWFSVGNSATIDPFVRLFTDGTPASFRIREDAGGLPNSFEITGSTTVTDGDWHHFCATYDATTMELYVDGQSEGTTTTDGDAVTLDRTTLGALGRTGEVLYWSGNISDVRVYGTALTASQVQALVDVVRSPGDWLGVGKLS